jgi:hypothetical protein
MAKRSSSRKLWQPLRIPSTATSSRYQGGKAHAAPHPRIENQPQAGDQVEIDCGGGAFQHKEGAIPPTSTHADSPGKRTYDRR